MYIKYIKLHFLIYFQITDKQIKDVSLNNRQNTAEEPGTQTNYETVQHDSSGLGLRRRTISSTTVPTSTLNQSTVSTETSVQPNHCTASVTGARSRGRPSRRKNHNRVTNVKSLKKDIIQQVVENNVCTSTSTVIMKESTATNLERLEQKQLLNQSTYDNNFKEKLKINNLTDDTSIDVNTNKINCMLLSHIDKNNESDLLCKKKNNVRKRKSNIEEPVARKRLLISNNPKDSLAMKENASEIPQNPNVIKEKLYGFLGRYSQQHIGLEPSFYNSSIVHNRIYWPVSWEYSSLTLTGHVQKKASKDTLRKIRVICDMAATTKSNSAVSTSLKTNSTLTKYQTSVIQRRGSNNKLMSMESVEMSNDIKHLPSTSSIIVKRPRGRPPRNPSLTSSVIKNKLLQSIIKSSSPRKSPRQHASTLAAIMSNKILSTDKSGNEQLDKSVIVDLESNKNSLDVDGQLYHQFTTSKRRRQCRSITPPPPKLCAQRTHINTIDHDMVKLRTKNVDLVRRRARDERLRAPFICQQLRKVQKLAEQNRRDLVQDILQTQEKDEKYHQFLDNHLIFLPLEINQDYVWSCLPEDSNQEPDNMCLQIMYERTGDKRFLYSNLSDDTLQVYYQQRNLSLAERLMTNNNGETVSSDLGTDIISTSNKRKKKRPNMTGWPKEKRRKNTCIKTDTLNGDSDLERNDDIIKRRRAAAAEQQRLRRRRLKLEQQQLANETKSKIAITATPIRKRPGRRPGPNKKFKTTTYRRTHSNSSSTTTSIREKKFKIRKQKQQHLPIKNKTIEGSIETVAPNTIVKRRCGRPKGSMNRSKLLLLQNNKKLSFEQQKENVQQSSTGKLKCVISTRNNRMKLLSTSRNSLSTNSSQKKTISVGKSKKSTTTYNLSSSCLEPLSSSTTRTTAKKKRLQQQMATSTWDAGRPKRYNHSRNTCTVVVEDCCFVGSQPFEQHCPGGGGGLSHNTVLENQKENTVHSNGL